MASPSTMCSSCLRTAQRNAIRAQIVPRRIVGYSSRAYRTAPAISQPPLYLDFLAPSSWKTHTIAVHKASKPILSNRTSIRTLTTAAATTSSTPQSSPPPPSQDNLARPILNPRTDSDGKPMSISISPRAANRLSSIAASDNNPDSALRITIESGGCHGFQYLMDLVDLSKTPAAEDDTVFEGNKGAKVVIDEASLELLNGSTVDYTMELIGSQFKVTGIPGATSSCGCGTSFDIKI